eukprot:IDg12754t1
MPANSLPWLMSVSHVRPGEVEDVTQFKLRKLPHKIATETGKDSRYKVICALRRTAGAPRGTRATPKTKEMAAATRNSSYAFTIQITGGKDFDRPYLRCSASALGCALSRSAALAECPHMQLNG